jgi:hypothetical protein
MANRLFRGDSPPVAQMTKVTPANVVVGDTFTITCNGKNISFVATASTVANVVAGLVAAISASSIPEFQEMLASAAPDNSYLTLTAATAGVPFIVSTSTKVTTAGNITVVETTPGQPAIDEVHKISLIGNYSGGTFTITYNFGAGNVTTGNIAYNATAAAVQTALVALTGVGAGNVIVTGGPGPNSPWFAHWTGTLGGQAIAVGTINGANLTGNGAVVITETTRGNGLSNAIQSISAQYATGGTYTLTLDGQTTGAIAFNATAATVQTAIQALPNVGSGNALVFGTGGGTGSPTGNGTDAPNKDVYYVVFTGALAGTNVSLMTLNAGNLTWSVQIPTCQIGQTGGQTSSDDWQIIDLGGATSGTFTVTYNGNTSAPVNVIPQSNAVGGAAFQLNVNIRPIANVTANDITVYSSSNFNGQGSESAALPVSLFLTHFQGAKANTAMQLFTVNGGGLTGSSGQTVTRISAGQANVNEVWSIYVLATGGTFTLSLNGQTTSAIAFNAASGTIQTRIQTDLNNSVTACTVSGSGTLASPWIVTVTNPANTAVGPPTGNGASLTGGGGTIVEVTHGAAGVNEVQTVTEAAGINGGTFTLAFNGAVTAPQAWNVSNTNLQTALRGLSTIGGTNVNVAGSGGGPYTVTFVGALGNTNVPLLVGDGSLLTGFAGTQTLVASTLTFSSGPNHYNDPINWTGGRIPDSADAVFFEEGDSNCLYGMQQIATFTANAGSDTITFTSSCDLVADQIVNVTNAGGGLPGGLAAATPYYLINVNRDAGTAQLSLTSGGSIIDITTAGTGTHTVGIRLAALEFNSKYSGTVGLSKLNGLGYYEYRPLYLHIGLQAAGAKTLTIGTGSGSGSGKLQLDTDVDQVAIKVIESGGSSETGIPAILWKGTHASNSLNLIDGDVGVALYAGETATIAPLTMRGGNLELGAGATITGIDKTGGTLLSNGATINGVCVL